MSDDLAAAGFTVRYIDDCAALAGATIALIEPAAGLSPDRYAEVFRAAVGWIPDDPSVTVWWPAEIRELAAARAVDPGRPSDLALQAIAAAKRVMPGALLANAANWDARGLAPARAPAAAKINRRWRS